MSHSSVRLDVHRAIREDQLMINNGKCKLDKEIENVQFAEKRNTRSVIRAKSSAHGIQKLKKSLRLKGIKGW